MPLIPRLPVGYHAQPAFHHQEGRIGYDLFRVYDVQRELDPLRTFWLVTEDSDTRGPQPPRTRWLAFTDWVRAHHGGEEDYGVFANLQAELGEVRRWIDATQSGDLIEIQEP